MPSITHLRKLGRNDLNRAISVKWGGINKVAERLGYQIDRKPKNYWSEWENLKKEILPICQKLKRFPTPREMGKNSAVLRYAIQKFGGTNTVASKLGYVTVRMGMEKSKINRQI